MLHNERLERWKHHLEHLSPPSILTRFTALGSFIVILEIILGCWPVVATSIWGDDAVDTWIHFMYWIKAFFLGTAILQTRWAPWRLAMNAGPANQLGLLQLCVGATASCELSTWIMLSVIAHALLSSVVLLIVLVLQTEFENNTQWILSVVFDGVAIIESILSPLILTSFGLRHVLQLHPTSFEEDHKYNYPPPDAFAVPSHMSPPPPPSPPSHPIIDTQRQVSMETKARYDNDKYKDSRRNCHPKRNPYGV